MADMLFPKSDLIDVSILINGKAIPNDIQIISIYCETGFNLIPMLNLGLSGPIDDKENNVAPWLNNLDLKAGSQIEVKAGYEGELATIFKGDFMGLTMSLDDDLGVMVQVDAISPVFKLDLEMDIFHFENTTIKEIVKTLTLEEGFALEEDLEDLPTDDVYFEGTGWELLLEVAEETDRILVVNHNSIQMVKPTNQSAPVGTLEVGNNILDMELSLDAFSEDEKERFGEIVIPGTAVVSLNDHISLKGSGKLFDGDALVVSITHDMAEGQWETVLGISMG